MKKIICMILCVLLLSALAATAFAAGSATITLTPSKEAVAHGEEVTVTVSITDVANCKSAGIAVAYDTDALEMVSGECLVSGIISDFDVSSGVGVWTNTSTITLSGDIYRFTFRVKENASIANGGLISVRPSVNDAEGSVECETVSLKLTITCSHEYGTWNRLNDDQHGQSCTKCGDVVKEDHTWDAGKTEIEATCAKGGLTIYTCTKCNATKEITTERLPHAYDNACDTECNNGCGTTREPDHDYDNDWSSDDTNHWHQCSVCGDRTDVLAHEPGAAATEWSAQKCRVCDHVLQPALGHTHNYETQWTKDDRGHWYTCKGCEEMKSYADHVYDNSCDTDCNTCGHVRTIQHTVDPNWWFDADGHWHECTVCGEKSRVEPHVPGPEATETSAQNCVDCGYELAPMVGHTHEYGYDWYFDDAGHWQQCSCGGTSVREAHVWNDGTVTREPTSEMDGEMYYVCTVCDAEKREPIEWQGGQTPTEPTRPSIGEPDPQPKEFPWWILVVAGGVLVLGFVIFMIVGAILGQKKTGKFSEK